MNKRYGSYLKILSSVIVKVTHLLPKQREDFTYTYFIQISTKGLRYLDGGNACQNLCGRQADRGLLVDG